MKNYTFAQKDEFVKAMQGQLTALNQDLDKLSAKIDSSSDAVKAEAKPKLQALRDQATKLNQQLADASNATESTWDGVKADSKKRLHRSIKRSEFQKMISAARSKEFDVILVHKFDRFARNDYDFVVYEKELGDLGIVLESISEPGDASTPSGYIGRRMMQVISTWYSKNLSVETKKGMQKKVENGGWPKKAPFGYLNLHNQNSAWIGVDPKNGYSLLKHSRRWQPISGHSKIGLRKLLQEVTGRNGIKISKTKWSDIFHNRFYLGETWLKRGDIPLGSHLLLVPEALFTRVQEILRKHDKHKQRTHHHKYLLRGLVYSLDANSPCWSETHPEKRVSYYRSRDKANERNIYYNTRDIEQQLPNIFKSITINESVLKDLRKKLAEFFDSEANTNDELQKAEARLLKLERMEKNLQRLAMEEEISFGDFKGHRAQIESERARLNTTIDSIKQRQHLVKADFEIALQLSTELNYLFKEENFDEKRLICETVFKRLMIKKGNIETIEFNSPFSLIAAQAKSSGTVSIGVGRGI